MFFIIISLILFVSIDACAAEPKQHGGWAAEDIEHLNDCVKERADEVMEQFDERMENRINQAFDRAVLLRVIIKDDIHQMRMMVKDDIHQIMHDETIDLMQNMTKMIIASSLGLGAVIGLYQTVKAAIALAVDADEKQKNQQYVTMISCAGVAALCASCSLMCYWLIN